MTTNISKSIRPYNSFGIDAKCIELIEIKSVEQAIEVLNSIRDQQFMILGGGSNVLFSHDYPGTILLNRIMGRSIIDSDNDYVTLEAMSGENWHQMVLWSIENGAYGLENLSLIPGSVGAAPIQNIGAYGTEIKHWCHSVTAIHIPTGQIHELTNAQCKFGYRDSVFKNEFKGQYLITKVTFKLHTAESWTPNISYGDIKHQLAHHGVSSSPTPTDISNAVIQIRSSKLPDPSILGNAGSFFKNPIITKDLYQRLLASFPDIRAFVYPHEIKLSAAWLIEATGFKGKRIGNVGCHHNQALVIVNHGGASGREIVDFSDLIIDQVYQKFGVLLEREVNIY